MVETRKFEVYQDGDYYGFVEIPLSALQDGWECPKYIVVDGITCEHDGNNVFIRKEPKK